MNETQQLDTAYYIFKEIFHVRIPYIQMRSVEDIEFYGMPVAGHSSFDRQIVNELQDIMIPIAKMAEYYKNGAQIYIVGQDNIKKIYDHITNHLNAWKAQISYNMHIAKAPIDDLKLLDQFANSVYEHAKYQFTDEIIGSITGKFSSDLRKISRIDLLLRPADQINAKKPIPTSSNVVVVGEKSSIPPASIEPEEKQYPQRESMVKFIDERKNQTGIQSLNGQQPANPQSRSRLLDSGGLSYQSLMQKGRQWRS